MRFRKYLGVIAAAGLVGASQPAFSAPWQYGTEPGLFEIQSASQVDSSGAYKLVFDCSAAMGLAVYSMAIIEPEPWDATASYAPEVPTRLEVDGSSREIDFFFAARASAQAVSLYEDPALNGDFFEFVRDALRSENSIRIRYFDRDLQFSGDGAAAGLTHVTVLC
jgi:hypothetical protein